LRKEKNDAARKAQQKARQKAQQEVGLFLGFGNERWREPV
jgi:hypothetical protein